MGRAFNKLASSRPSPSECPSVEDGNGPRRPVSLTRQQTRPAADAAAATQRLRRDDELTVGDQNAGAKKKQYKKPSQSSLLSGIQCSDKTPHRRDGRGRNCLRGRSFLSPPTDRPPPRTSSCLGGALKGPPWRESDTSHE